MNFSVWSHTTCKLYVSVVYYVTSSRQIKAEGGSEFFCQLKSLVLMFYTKMIHKNFILPLGLSPFTQ